VALTPHFDRIVATVTSSDIEKFLRSDAPADDKQRVLNASSDEIKMRLVGGYLIRTNQVTAERLHSGGVPVKAAKAAKVAKPRKASAASKA
jgi:hypothetical protein